MLGHRGCRLGITYPEIYEMQARAIFEAACDVAGASGVTVVPEIMIPLVGAGERAASCMRAADRRGRRARSSQSERRDARTTWSAR